MRKTLIAALVVAATSLVIRASTMAATIDVPADQPTIQAGIDAASYGDTVQVAAGTYYENVTLRDGVNVIGAGAEDTIIDGGGSDRVVLAEYVGSTTRFEGFTIRNGSASGGGGMATRNSSLTVANCVFSDNKAVDYGGGMFNLNSSPTVENCVFSGNSADYGGGLAVSGGKTTIVGSTFSGNSAKGGGGIWASFGAAVHVDESAFLLNSALWDGGGMYTVNSYDVVVTNSAFIGNSAADGGGMHNFRSPQIVNSVFSGNTAVRGGGMFNYSESPLLAWSPTLTNCTFTNNSADFGGGMFNVYSEPTVTNCILWGDTGGEIHNAANTTPEVSYCVVMGGYVGGSNIIDVDPLFVNPAAGNVHLRFSSPAIDAGNNDAPLLPDTDFEGDPRIANGTVDMGADEFISVDIEGVLKFFDDSVADRTLRGAGAGASATRRLHAFRNMLETASGFIAGGYIPEACEQLKSAMNVSGDPTPPADLVEGDSSDELWALIYNVRSALGCSSAAGPH